MGMTKERYKKEYPKIRKCKECGREFYAKSPPHKYCHNPCISPKTRYNVIKYKYILGMRSAYSKYKEFNPEGAKRIKDEMIKEEGKTFTEMALDGM